MSKERKIVFSLKGNDRPIVLTDISDVPLDDLRSNLKDIFSKNSVCEMVSNKDCLIVRSDQISAIMISTDGEQFKKSEPVPEVKESIEKTEKKEKTVNYVQELEISE